jgi:hypothetical protein
MEDPKPALHLTKTLERVRTNASKVRVTCGTSGKSVTVRINDRRPLHGNRVLDRFREAASKIGIIGAVVGKVNRDPRLTRAFGGPQRMLRRRTRR